MEVLLTKKEESRQSSLQDTCLVSWAIEKFKIFFNCIFSIGIARVEGDFIPGKHKDEWCERLQSNSHTSTQAARKHHKSTILGGFIAWHLFRLPYTDYLFDEFLYLSYKEDLSAYHLRKIKRYIDYNPYFKHFISLTQAETILHYSMVDENGRFREFICEPEGILSFKRGRHPRIVLLDDILRDPEVKLDISQIEKITEIFDKQVASLPKEKDGQLHIMGTPQHKQDLFSRLEKRREYNCGIYKAVLNYDRKKVLWPEQFSFERLMQIRDEIGQKAFNQEYQCSPVHSEEGYFNELEIDKIIKSRLKNYPITKKEIRLNDFSYGGLDIGKKRHPSHLTVYGKSKSGKLIQIHSKWMDGWDYTRQLEYCREAIKFFRMVKLRYDNTRAEFEGFDEKGELPPEMEGVNFTAKEKSQMAVAFEKIINQKKILLLNDERQKRQILNVNNDLKSVESAEGHGDSFWSNALAISGAEDIGVNIRTI